MRRETRSAPQKRLKVARIIARLNIGGPAIQACYLHQALRPEFDTVLITGRLDEGEGDMSYLLKSDDGVQWLGTMSRPVRIWSDITSLFRLVRILRHEARNPAQVCGGTSLASRDWRHFPPARPQHSESR